MITVTGIPAALEMIQKVIEEEKTALQNSYAAEVRSRTPIDKGTARRGWQKRTSGKDRIIENRVPYIERLEKGYSRQAPNGFTHQAVTATINKRKTT